MTERIPLPLQGEAGRADSRRDAMFRSGTFSFLVILNLIPFKTPLSKLFNAAI